MVVEKFCIHFKGPLHWLGLFLGPKKPHVFWTFLKMPPKDVTWVKCSPLDSILGPFTPYFYAHLRLFTPIVCSKSFFCEFSRLFHALRRSSHGPLTAHIRPSQFFYALYTTKRPKTALLPPLMGFPSIWGVFWGWFFQISLVVLFVVLFLIHIYWGI